MIFIRHGQSEFNVIYGQTRQDPGIEDPAITKLGVAQAEQAACFLDGMNVRRLISSPYRRALQTAAIIAKRLGLSIAVNPMVREHYAFSCDIGTPRDGLIQEWPGIDFSQLEERWWPHEDETDDLVAARGRAFIETSTTLPDRDQIAVVSHWGFIRGITGLKVTNGTVLRVDLEGQGVVVGTPNP
jgi:broad specificity phosphatase PhoE